MSSKRPASNEASKSKGKAPKYQKLSSREHVLKRSDNYTGTTNSSVSENTIIKSDGTLDTKEFQTVPAFLQCVEEMLMNAADRVSAYHEENNTIVNKTNIPNNLNTRVKINKPIPTKIPIR